MKQIIADLHQDHQHISAVLCILKNKLATLELSGRPNFNLMSDVLDYLDEYADGYHHAREDLVFGFVRTHYPEADNLVSQARREHLELSQLTAALRDSVEQVLMDQPFSIQNFSKRLKRFIDKQSQHLSFEEGRLLPLVDRLMTPADWRQFVEQVQLPLEPLVEAARKERYQRLYNALIEDLA